MINPRGVKIVANTVGFFIANDAEEVRRANAFCKVFIRNYLIVTRKPSFAGNYFEHNKKTLEQEETLKLMKSSSMRHSNCVVQRDLFNLKSDFKNYLFVTTSNKLIY